MVCHSEVPRNLCRVVKISHSVRNDRAERFVIPRNRGIWAPWLRFFASFEMTRASVCHSEEPRNLGSVVKISHFVRNDKEQEGFGAISGEEIRIDKPTLSPENYRHKLRMTFRSCHSEESRNLL